MIVIGRGASKGSFGCETLRSRGGSGGGVSITLLWILPRLPLLEGPPLPSSLPFLLLFGIYIILYYNILFIRNMIRMVFQVRL